MLIQEKNIHNLKHHIGQDEKKLTSNVLENQVAVDHRKVEDHVEERNEMLSFENNFNALRKELNLFLSEWM